MVKRNVYAEIAELYGLAFTEPFRIISANKETDELYSWGLLDENGFKFTDNAALDDTTSWVDDSETVIRILSGEIVVMGGWTPTDGEAYYFIQNSDGSVRKTIYNRDETLDALNIGNHNCFKTQGLAESQKAIVVKRIFGIDLNMAESPAQPETSNT